MAKHHWQHPKQFINEIKYCSVCGNRLYKVEKYDKKICPENCCEIDFIECVATA